MQSEPILYLIIINTLVSEEPSCEMPEWDNKFREEAYKQGVQMIKEEMVGQLPYGQYISLWMTQNFGQRKQRI